MSLAGLGVVAIWHDLLPEAPRRLPRMAQPRAHARARRHSGLSPRPPLRRDQRHARVLQSVRGRSPGNAVRPGLPQPPQFAHGVDAARRSVVSQRRPLDLPRRVHQRRRQRRRDAHAALRDRCRASREHDRRAAPAACCRRSCIARASPACTCAWPTKPRATSRPRSARRAPTRPPCLLDRAGRRHLGAGRRGAADDLVPALAAHGAPRPSAPSIASNTRA